MAGKVKEFASAWHRNEYVAALEREASALEQRLEQLGGNSAPAAIKAELTTGIKKAKAELDRVKRTRAPKDDEEETETSDDEKTEE